MKKINPNTTLQTLKVGVFEIRLSEAKVEIETESKEWKYVIAAKTRPYAELVSLVAKDYREKIHILCNALYSSTLFFYYPEFCVEWLQVSQKQVDRMRKEIEKNANLQ